MDTRGTSSNLILIITNVTFIHLHPRWNINNTKMFSIPPSLPAVTPCLESVAALWAGQGSSATRPAPQVTMERTAGIPVTVTTEPTATASLVPACAHRATW